MDKEDIARIPAFV